MGNADIDSWYCSPCAVEVLARTRCKYCGQSEDEEYDEDWEDNCE